MLALLCFCVATEFSAKKGLYNVCLMSHYLICVCLSLRVRVHLFGTNELCENGWTDRNACGEVDSRGCKELRKLGSPFPTRTGNFGGHIPTRCLLKRIGRFGRARNRSCATNKGLCDSGGGADRHYHYCSNYRELSQKRGRSQSAGALVFIVKYILRGVANNGIDITLWRVEPVAIVRRF